MLLIEELKERILTEGYDECLLCDILEINSEEILDRFEDKLELNRDEFTDKKDSKDLDF